MPKASEGEKIRNWAISVIFLLAPIIVALAFNLPIEATFMAFVFGLLLVWLCLNIPKYLKKPSKTEASIDAEGLTRGDKTEDLSSSITSKKSQIVKKDLPKPAASSAVASQTGASDEEKSLGSDEGDFKISESRMQESDRSGGLSPEVEAANKDNPEDKGSGVKTKVEDISGVDLTEANQPQIKISQPQIINTLKSATSLAKIELIIEFSDEAFRWLDSIPSIGGEEAWFKRKRGKEFFSRYEGDFRRLIRDYAQDTVTKHFLDLEFPKAGMPVVKVDECYVGSIHCILDITTSVPLDNVLAILSALGTTSLLPEMAEGVIKFPELKRKLDAKLHQGIDAFVRERLKSISIEYNAPPVPETVTFIGVSIDATFLAATTADASSHDIHLNAALPEE